METAAFARSTELIAEPMRCSCCKWYCYILCRFELKASTGTLSVVVELESAKRLRTSCPVTLRKVYTVAAMHSRLSSKPFIENELNSSRSVETGFTNAFMGFGIDEVVTSKDGKVCFGKGKGLLEEKRRWYVMLATCLYISNLSLVGRSRNRNGAFGVMIRSVVVDNWLAARW